MAIDRRHYCSRCGDPVERDLLTVKKAGFYEMGVGGKAIRVRVTDHLCPKCLVSDADYQRPAFSTPGTKPVLRPQLNG